MDLVSKKCKARSNKLKKDFYLQSTSIVAKELLGKILVHRISPGIVLKGKIVETEAYLGLIDPACHTFEGRRTNKNSAMYLNGGHCYVYFIYGMYYCFNVVTGCQKNPEAVLIRALEPIEGLEYMQKKRKTNKPTNIASGPGKLCIAMGIDKQINAQSLFSRKIYIENSSEKLNLNNNIRVVKTTRIGINYAGEAKYWELRFYIKDSPFISQK